MLFQKRPSAAAEHPGNAKLSYKKYYSLRRLIFSRFIDKFNSDALLRHTAFVLKYGDTQPALVCSADPLLIACYSDEMDAVVMLDFPKELAGIYGLSPGARLVTANVYKPNVYNKTRKDIFPGKYFSGLYNDFSPIVMLFIAKSDDKLREKAKLFDEHVWSRVEKLARDYLAEHPEFKRDGFFYLKPGVY